MAEAPLRSQYRGLLTHIQGVLTQEPSLNGPLISSLAPYGYALILFFTNYDAWETLRERPPLLKPENPYGHFLRVLLNTYSWRVTRPRDLGCHTNEAEYMRNLGVWGIIAFSHLKPVQVAEHLGGKNALRTQLARMNTELASIAGVSDTQAGAIRNAAPEQMQQFNRRNRISDPDAPLSAPEQLPPVIPIWRYQSLKKQGLVIPLSTVINGRRMGTHNLLPFLHALESSLTPPLFVGRAQGVTLQGAVTEVCFIHTADIPRVQEFVKEYYHERMAAALA